MLLFLCTFRDGSLPPDGLASTGEPFRLHRTLDAARAACRAPDPDGEPGGKGVEGRVLVLDPDRLALVAGDPPAAHRIPSAAVLNLDVGAYRAPEPVEAAGGYVVRRSAGGLEVLLIFRRGAWDLPKGKLDRGETPEAGALREVSEEVGVPPERLRLLRPLGATLHGYPHPKRPTYAVKTTHWYAMATDAGGFTPQGEEDIEAVAWVPWAEAGARLGYASLRTHLAALDPDALGV